MSSEEPPVPEISVETLAALLAGDGPPLLVDVRQPEEFAAARVPGAQLLPLDQVPGRVEDFPRGEPVYLICQSGGRSYMGAEFLRSQGVDAINVAGGTMAWVGARMPYESGAR